MWCNKEKLYKTMFESQLHIQHDTNCLALSCTYTKHINQQEYIQWVRDKNVSIGLFVVADVVNVYFCS